MPRHSIIAASTVLAALLLLPACNKSQNDDGLRHGKTLRIGNGAEPQGLDPHVVTGVGEHKIITALIEGLVTEAEDPNKIAPGSAERWEISDDGLTYTFYIRKNARWSTGDPVTSHDFVRSFQRMLTPALAAEYAYKLFHLVNAEDYYMGKIKDFTQVGVEAPDEHTLILRLHHPVPYLLESLKHYSWFPIHPATLEKFGAMERKGTQWTRPGNYVGNGPFILKEWSPNQKIVVTRSPTYWDAETVKLDAIEFYAVDNPEAEERLFRTGQLDYAYSLPLNKLDVYRKKYPEVFKEKPYYGVYYYRLNTTRPPFNDKRVRKALALTINREAIVKSITRGGQVPAYNFTPPSEKFTSTARINGNIEEARRLLAEAGYPNGEGFPRVYILFNTLEGHRVIAEAIQQMLKKELNIDIHLLNQEWQIFLSTTRDLDYDLSRAGWIGDENDPSTFLDLWSSWSGNNQTGWINEEYDRLLTESMKQGDEAKRMEIYQRLDEILTEELPVIPIYFYTRIYAISPKVKNWNDSPLDNRAWKYIDLVE